MINKHKAIAQAKQYQIRLLTPSRSAVAIGHSKQEDYRYVTVPEMARRVWQTGGESSYCAVSKYTGKVSVLELAGSRMGS